jgi:hypothetical protein
MAALVRREECASASAVSSEVKLKLAGLAHPGDFEARGQSFSSKLKAGASADALYHGNEI